MLTKQKIYELNSPRLNMYHGTKNVILMMIGEEIMTIGDPSLDGTYSLEKIYHHGDQNRNPL